MRAGAGAGTGALLLVFLVIVECVLDEGGADGADGGGSGIWNGRSVGSSTGGTRLNLLGVRL
ncbi:hypothetical protein FRB91_006124 [Serendipita sp. 411]|nr:hypothetical protein FRC18_008685 [Serendipita sp. 400]KAG8840409.1 hypothetical protein FRB91_006124 [Serendipita sp. 411]